LSEPLQKWY